MLIRKQITAPTSSQKKLQNHVRNSAAETHKRARSVVTRAIWSARLTTEREHLRERVTAEEHEDAARDEDRHGCDEGEHVHNNAKPLVVDHLNSRATATARVRKC